MDWLCDRGDWQSTGLDQTDIQVRIEIEVLNLKLQAVSGKL